mgnify:CR=1 FL=1
MSLLLPFLNSPTTMTRTFGSCSRLRVLSSRSARSARPVAAASDSTLSTSATSCLPVCGDTIVGSLAV